MNNAGKFELPDKLDLMIWFGCEPEEPYEGCYRYQIADDSNVKLLFSFDVFNPSIQTSLYANDSVVAVVVHENAKRLWIEDLGNNVSHLRAEFDIPGACVQLRIKVKPKINVSWSLLQVE